MSRVHPLVGADLPEPNLGPIVRANTEWLRDQQKVTAHGTGRRADAGKLRWDLLPMGALEEVVQVYTMGAAKYGDRNWEGGIAFANCFAALMRHLVAWWRGETRDPDGQHHLASVVFWALALMHFQAHGTVPDERPLDMAPKA